MEDYKEGSIFAGTNLVRCSTLPPHRRDMRDPPDLSSYDHTSEEHSGSPPPQLPGREQLFHDTIWTDLTLDLPVSGQATPAFIGDRLATYILDFLSVQPALQAAHTVALGQSRLKATPCIFDSGRHAVLPNFPRGADGFRVNMADGLVKR